MRDKVLGTHKSVPNMICGSLATLALTLTAGIASADMTGRVMVTSSIDPDKETPKERFVACPDDTKPIGGGAIITGEWAEVALKGSIPSTFTFPSGETKPGWLATASRTSSAAGEWGLEVTVICATSD